MPRKTYEHSAYYYAYHYGWTKSEARTYVGKYLDQHTYRPRLRKRPGDEWTDKDWFRWRKQEKAFDSTFNPLLLCALAVVDIGNALREDARRLRDPVLREERARELKRDLRRARRPFYYEQEVKRRRSLAAERRKLHRRTTVAPLPTAEAFRAAWAARKTSRTAMITLGSLLHDLECYVDNCLKIDEYGNVIGRNSGIKGWIREVVPELLPKYKTLMRYKALALRLRQVTNTQDPIPTAWLLEEKPLQAVVATILADEEPVFSHVMAHLEHLLSPATVMLDAPPTRTRGRRRRKA
jgi:hypothetical protein